LYRRYVTELFNCNNFIVSQVNPHINFVLHLAEVRLSTS
jgi:TAG lipase/steryl ester hydrolase/phospholipase A2/LPA acyltransferase